VHKYHQGHNPMILPSKMKSWKATL